MSIQSMLLGSSAQPLDATTTSDSAYGSRRGAGTVTTTGISLIPMGGAAPFTYAWTYFSGDNSFTATSPTGQNTGWTGNVNLGQDKESIWKGVVTDNLGQTSPPQFVNLMIQDTSFV